MVTKFRPPTKPKKHVEYIVMRVSLSDGELEAIPDETFDTRPEALAHRDWTLGHFGMVLMCWVEKSITYRQRTGAYLVRDQHSGPIKTGKR
jgi:hypothetical protein